MSDINDLDELSQWVAPLLKNLSAQSRKRMNRQIAREIRTCQRARIKAQENPDGTPYEPRKPQHWKSGSIKRQAMFKKLRTNKYLKAWGTPTAAGVGFFGSAAYIARVHQYGLHEHIKPGGINYDYPRRILLGYTKAGREAIADAILDHLQPDD